MAHLKLQLLSAVYAISRLDPGEKVPHWVDQSEIVSISRTPEELSILCEQEGVPDGVRAERDWRCFKVQGPLSFELTGILSSILGPLAKAGISILAFSTFDTDYVLVKEASLSRALKVFEDSGFFTVVD